MIGRALAQIVDGDWIEFPGGELEGTRPRALCPDCRARLRALARAGRSPEPSGRRSALCFRCYRAELDRERALRAAGELETASDARFQSTLPFEPVNVARLERLRADRAAARVTLRRGTGQFVERRHRAQIAARHALEQIAVGLRARYASRGPGVSVSDQKTLAAAAHAAELQLPDAWLPFVVSS